MSINSQGKCGAKDKLIAQTTDYFKYCLSSMGQDSAVSFLNKYFAATPFPKLHSFSDVTSVSNI